MKSKQERREEAKVRQEEYNTLTAKQKLMKLDLKLGGDIGAKQQRNKLTLEAIRKNIEKAEYSLPKEEKSPYQKPKRS